MPRTFRANGWKGAAGRRAAAADVRTAARTASSLSRRLATRIPRSIAAPRLSNISGLKNWIDVKLVYAETFSLTGTLGYANYEFCANGVYDPNVTSTGHQPLYFDQYIALYERYMVKSSRIRLRPVQSTAPSDMSTGGIWYGVILTPQAGQSSTTWTTTMETLAMDNRSSDAKFISTQSQRNDENGRGSVFCKYDALRENAKTGIHELADSHKGDASSNPTNTFTYNCHFSGTDGVAMDTQRWIAEITYYVRFHDRKRVNGS